MREAFESFAASKGWFWITTLVLAVAVGYIVNLYLNFTWGLIHSITVLLIGALIYSISKPRER